MLHEVDIKNFNVRDVPKTAELLEQKLLSGTPEEKWWLYVLSNRRLPCGCVCTPIGAQYELFDNYIRHAQRQRANRRSIETELSIFLKKMSAVKKRNVGFKVRTMVQI